MDSQDTQENPDKGNTSDTQGGQNISKDQITERMDLHDPRRKKFLHGQRWTGLMLLIVGGILLLRQSGYPFPPWLFTWPTLLIIIGLFVGLRNRFHDLSWLIMILVGSVFLADNINPGLQLGHYAVPGIIILVGLIFIVSPRSKRVCHRSARHQARHLRMRRRFHQYYEQHMAEEARYAAGAHGDPGSSSRAGFSTPFRAEPDPYADTSNSTIDIVSVFSGVKKKILSKSFKGGEVVCIFGGAEINLTNADFSSPITIEFVQIFGGTKLVVPANWEVRSEVAAIFGSVEDKRPQPPNNIPEKTVILNGTVIFGGVEVSSF